MLGANSSNRIRFRLRLRSLFLLVLVCALATWLGLQIQWIQARRRALAEMQSQGAQAAYARWVSVGQGGALAYQWNVPPGRFSGCGLGAAAPWPLCVLGEQGIDAIALAGNLEQLRARQHELGPLFPEAQFEWIQDGSPNAILR